MTQFDGSDALNKDDVMTMEEFTKHLNESGFSELLEYGRKKLREYFSNNHSTIIITETKNGIQ